MKGLLNEIARERLQLITRQHFLRQCTTGLGGIWMATRGRATASTNGPGEELTNHFAPKVKRVIYLHMIGAPSQLELFDYKPELERHHGKPCPPEFLEGKRFAFIKGVPNMLGPQFPFARKGQSGAWLSDRLPHLSHHVDDIAFIKTMQTEQFNHGPAQLMVHTGNARMGQPSIGSWVTWGLGSENEDLPGFMVLLSGGRQPRVGKALWSAGMLPSVYQGVQCRSKGDPVLNVANPSGVSRAQRRSALDALARINQRAYESIGDEEILTRISQYEMAFRMQMAVPDVMDISQEPEEIHELYGTQPGKESLANNCLMARRLAERGVRYIQLFDWGWDTHGSSKSESLNGGFLKKCRDMDRPVAALLTDLKRRGMLDDTLVVWGGEFGRTPMQENRGGNEMKFVGRDHNPGAFTVWMAGGGVRRGLTYGETDPMGYQAVTNPVPVRDLHATMLQLLGFDHEKLSVPFQGLDQKLTGVQHAKVIQGVLG
ncbi:MAG: DUF1501 domain-containing protein [Verrucomicrobiota bacterium]